MLLHSPCCTMIDFPQQCYHKATYPTGLTSVADLLHKPCLPQVKTTSLSIRRDQSHRSDLKDVDQNRFGSLISFIDASQEQTTREVFAGFAESGHSCSTP